MCQLEVTLIVDDKNLTNCSLQITIMSLDDDLRFPNLTHYLFTALPYCLSCSNMAAVSLDITFWARRNEKKIEYSTKCIREAKASPNSNRLTTFCLQIAAGWMWNHKCLKSWSPGGLEDYCLLRKQKLVRWHKSLEVSIEVLEFSSTSFLFSKQPMSTIWAAASCPCCQSSATMNNFTLECETKWSCFPINYLSRIWSQSQEN